MDLASGFWRNLERKLQSLSWSHPQSNPSFLTTPATTPPWVLSLCWAEPREADGDSRHLEATFSVSQNSSLSVVT